MQAFRPAVSGGPKGPHYNRTLLALVVGVLGASTLAHAQASTGPTAAKSPKPTTKPATPAAPTTKPVTPTPPGASVPTDFIIGPDDVLTVFFWREKDLSGDVVVRPDGRISLPLLNDVQAAGLTPEQLRQKLTESASKYLEEPNVTVIVKAINSRKVFITGQVSKPGSYPLVDAMTAIQLIAMAGGLLEFADQENIVVVRVERRPDGQPWSYRVNYAEVMKRLNPKQNIDLKPGDTILVP